MIYMKTKIYVYSFKTQTSTINKIVISGLVQMYAALYVLVITNRCHCTHDDEILHRNTKK